MQRHAMSQLATSSAPLLDSREEEVVVEEVVQRRTELSSDGKKVYKELK